jgi:hypothetical protein
MREGQQKQTELLLTALQTQRAPAVDPAGMLTALVTAMATMQKMMAPPAPAIVAPPPDNGLKAADLILKGVELAKELGSNDGGAGPLDLLRDLFRSPFLAELAAQSQRVAVSAPRAAPPGARLTGAAPAPATPAPVPQPPAATDEEIMFKSYVGAMVDRAARGSDPGLYAEYIVDNVPGPIITSWLAREDLIGYLTGMDSRVADHRQWFEDLREEINALLTEAPESVIHAGNVPESTAADADSQDT